MSQAQERCLVGLRFFYAAGELYFVTERDPSTPRLRRLLPLSVSEAVLAAGYERKFGCPLWCKAADGHGWQYGRYVTYQGSNIDTGFSRLIPMSHLPRELRNVPVMPTVAAHNTDPWWQDADFLAFDLDLDSRGVPVEGRRVKLKGRLTSAFVPNLQLPTSQRGVFVYTHYCGYRGQHKRWIKAMVFESSGYASHHTFPAQRLPCGAQVLFPDKK